MTVDLDYLEKLLADLRPQGDKGSMNNGQMLYALNWIGVSAQVSLARSAQEATK